MFDDAKYLAVFKIHNHAELSIRHSAIYSYIAYQDSYQSFPKKRLVASNTGVSESFVSKAMEDLTILGLIRNDQATPNNLTKWFLPKRKQAIHWSKSLQYFPIYVRAVDSELTFNESVIYSYLRHLASKGTDTSSVAYIVKCLGITDKTVSKSIRRLHEYFGLIGLSRRGNAFKFCLVDDELLAPLFRFAEVRGEAASVAAEPEVLTSKWLEEAATLASC